MTGPRTPRGARCGADWRRARLGQLSVVLRDVAGVRDGQTVEVVLGDGSVIVGRAQMIDAGVIRVPLPSR